jgi:hypothetical protein
MTNTTISPAGSPLRRRMTEDMTVRVFAPRQKPGSFNLDRVMESINRGASDK